VALKTLTQVTGDAASRLASEARMMAAVTHPNLATIYGLETWRSIPILVIELLDGGSMAGRAGEPQPIVDVLRLGTLLAPALEQLHGAGILHRDIKPSNIGFTRDGTPKMLDFGLATASDGRSLAAGTPLYVSPELAGGEPPSVHDDLWALALVLYEAIAGTHPFVAGTTPEVLAKVRRARTARLCDIRADCAPQISAAFGLFLSPDKTKRPTTATALRRELERLAGSLTSAMYETTQRVV
jgi:eukaryotic-like serine/threonine-protein kinase